MKRILSALFVTVLIASCAFAGVQDFGAFTIDVAAGWTAEQDGSTVGFVKNDNTASMSITVEGSGGATAGELAEAFVDALNGKNLTETDGGYEFEMTNANGAWSKCFLTADGDKYALIVVTGLENAPEDISAMMESLQEK